MNAALLEGVTVSDNLTTSGNTDTDYMIISGAFYLGSQSCSISVDVNATVNNQTNAVSGTIAGTVCGFNVNGTL